MSPLPVTFTVAQVAESLGVTPWWVREQAKRGVVRPMRVGDSANAPYRFAQGDVDLLVASMRPPAPVPRRRRRRVA